MTRAQAQRLLDCVPSSRAVVFGRVQAIAGQGTWEADLLIRWPGQTSRTASHVELVAPDELVVEDLHRDRRIPDRHEFHTDVQDPLDALIAEHYKADHVERIEGTLLAATAAELAMEADGCTTSSDHLRREAAECLSEAERYRARLSAQTRAEMELTRVDVEEMDSERAIVHLEAVGNADADHPQSGRTS